MLQRRIGKDTSVIMQDNNPTVLLQFLSYKSALQNCSQNTVLEYELDLILFFRFIIASRTGKIKELESISIEGVDEEFINSVRPDEVYSYLLYLTNLRGNKPNSRARRLSAIKAFYKYHTAKSHIVKINPVADVESPKKPKMLPKFLSLDESKKLLAAVDKSSDTYERDYCILTFFLNCGMRLSELVGINLTDFNDNMTSLVVTGKGAKQRVIYLNSACRAALNDYLAVREQKAHERGRSIADDSKNALVLSGRNHRISDKTVQWIVKRHLSLAGLDGKGYSTHKLRHTAATLMYNYGDVDVMTLKDILGHEQLNTTQIYTHVSNEKLAEAMSSNPLAEVKRKREK